MISHFIHSLVFGDHVEVRILWFDNIDAFEFFERKDFKFLREIPDSAFNSLSSVENKPTDGK